MISQAITSSLPTSQQPDKITIVARQFEAMFSSLMLKEMRKTVGEGTLLPMSTGEKIYTGMLDDEYAKLLGSNGTLGFATMIEKELRQHEAQMPSDSDMSLPPWMIDPSFLPAASSTRQTATGYADLAERIDKWSKPISHAAQEYNVPKELVAAVIAQESAGNPHAVSRAGAKGLMQLMDTTARELGITSSFDPEKNIDGGVRYLRQLLDKYNGNEQLALASYNAGPAAVDKYNGIPPYRETQEYVSSVQALRKLFEQRAPSVKAGGEQYE